ncbi:MAG TPA: HNH endonuclease signature motif containing protein [Terracidiphilus sp.]|jgi:hypothetical protein
MFTPARHRGNAKFFSKSCIWKATKGPEFNAKIAREFAKESGDRQRGRGDGKSYRKMNGHHEHRIVAEQKTGRPIEKSEVVHHVDGNRLNNDPSNLVVITRAQHMREHGLGIPGVTPPHEPWKLRGKNKRKSP